MTGKIRTQQTDPVTAPVSAADSDSRHRLGGAEAAVIIAVVLTAAALAYTGMPLLAILQLLLGAGVVGAVTVAAFQVRPARRLLSGVRAMLGVGQ
ncbi:hypothetical protein [Streptomyces sp. NPDC102282]|uniref:hypothetical protein n=1 Tax=Streptomyces sp. NPDC102282 TaxID=3366154 RepID=UPI00382B8C0C